MTTKDRLVKLLKKPNSYYKFKHLLSLTKATKEELELAIAEVRKEYPNLTFNKFDKTFYFSLVPTWYNHATDLSQEMPKEGVFGVVSDTHLCSIADRLDVLNIAYDTFSREGVKQVFHGGDFSDGTMVYRGHGQYVKIHGDQNQALYCIRNYPSRTGITTYAIAGNHCLDSFAKTGVDRMSLVVHGFQHEGQNVEGRKDIVYLGQFSHNIVLPEQVLIHIVHPMGNQPYALSYKQQKRSEAMSKELRPDLQLSGHYHVFNYCCLQGTHFIAIPGMQDATEYFTRLGLPRSLGFVLIHYKISAGKFEYLSPRLYMF